jgi:hypothetical protein
MELTAPSSHGNNIGTLCTQAARQKYLLKVCLEVALWTVEQKCFLAFSDPKYLQLFASGR